MKYEKPLTTKCQSVWSFQFGLMLSGLGRIIFIVHCEHLNEIKVKWTADSQGRAAPGPGCLAGVGLFDVTVIMLEHQRRRQPRPGRQVQIKGAAWWLRWLRSLLRPVGAPPLPPGHAQNTFSAAKWNLYTVFLHVCKSNYFASALYERYNAIAFPVSSSVTH